jgi:outer membrane protein TolC
MMRRLGATLFLLAGLVALSPVAPAAPQDPPAAGASATEAPQPPAAGGAGGSLDTAPADTPEGVEPYAVTLGDVLTYSLQNNLEIAVRRYDPLTAEARLMTAEAGFDPTLTGTARSNQSQQRQIFFRVPDLTDKTHEYTVNFEDPLPFGGRYGIQLSGQDTVSTTSSLVTDKSFFTAWEVNYRQSLLRGLGYDANRWQILVATGDVGISRERFRQSVLDALSQTEKAYWDLVFALMDLKTRRESLKLAQDFLGQNRIKVRVGTLAPIEITQAEAGVADREEGVIVAQNAVRTAEDALRRVVNLPKDSPLWSRPLQPTDMPRVAEFVADIDGAVTIASENRPDLKQARLEVRKREDELRYRRNQVRWGLDLDAAYGTLGFAAEQFETLTSCAPADIEPDTGICLNPVVTQTGNVTSYGSYGDSIDDLRDRSKTNWRIQMMLTVPVGNRLAKAGLNEADARLGQARYEQQRLESNAWVEVRNAVRQVETNLKRVKAAQVNVRLQREKLAAEQKKFENGMSTSFQVLEFQTDLSTAGSRENQAIVDLAKSRVELDRVKGTLLEARQMTMPESGSEATRSGGNGSSARAGLRPETATASLAVTLPTDFVYDGRSLHGVILPELR